MVSFFITLIKITYETLGHFPSAKQRILHKLRVLNVIVYFTKRICVSSIVIEGPG